MKKQSLFNVSEYIRLSREDGDKVESDSIGNQRKLIADYIKYKNDFFLYDTYIDDGFTGTNFERPGFVEMMDGVKKGKIQCVIVKDFSRFGRDYIELGDYIEHIFPFMQVRLSRSMMAMIVKKIKC